MTIALGSGSRFTGRTLLVEGAAGVTLATSFTDGGAIQGLI
jgi:hypothetical protein